MRVMVLVKATKDSEDGIMPSPELCEAMGRFNEQLVKAGIMQAGDGLKPTSHAKRVAFDGGKRTVIDGPFAETKVILGGILLLAGKIPGIGRLPGDIFVQKGNFTFYFPLVTSILLSLLLSVILNLFFRR